MTTLMDCIERIPAKIQRILNCRDDLFLKVKDYCEGKKIEKIVLVASGSSYNAAFTTKKFAEDLLNIPVEIIYPNIFANYFNQELITDSNLYIFISQGGSTKLVYNSLEIVKAKKLLNISITEKLDSPIAKLASLPIEMGSDNEEYVFRTIGFSTTCATLYWLYISLAKINNLLNEEDEIKYISDFNSVIDSLTEIKETTIEWYERNCEFLLKLDKFIFSGTSELWPIAQEADIKHMEMLPIFTRSFELEELIHGPQNAFDNRTGYFLLSRTGDNDTKVGKIFEFIDKEIGHNCFIVGNNAVNENDIKINVKSKFFNTLEYITVFQVLAYKLAVDKGRDLTRGIYPQINKYITKTL